MKRIIYTAVALIICASVFGIADYLNAKKKGALANYTDDVQTTEVIIPKKKTEIIAPEKEENLISDTKKEIKKEPGQEKKITKEKVKKDDHYTGVVPELMITEKTKDLDQLISKVNLMDILQSKTSDESKTDSIIPESNKRRINMEMFSRAPIREKKIRKK